MNGVLTKRGNLDPGTDRREDEREDAGSRWPPTRRGDRPETDSPTLPRGLRGNPPCPHLDLGLPASRVVGNECLWFKLPGLQCMLQQPETPVQVTFKVGLQRT